MTIYVDAMGGDYAPEAPVRGTLEALRAFPDLKVILAGKQDEIKPFLTGWEDNHQPRKPCHGGAQKGTFCHGTGYAEGAFRRGGRICFCRLHGGYPGRGHVPAGPYSGH